MSIQSSGETETNHDRSIPGWGYVDFDAKEPTDEERLTAYQGYRNLGGDPIKFYEELVGTWIEPPTIKERIVKAGSQVLSVFRRTE